MLFISYNFYICRDLKKKNKKAVVENVKEDESENMQDPTEKVHVPFSSWGVFNIT